MKTTNKLAALITGADHPTGLITARALAHLGITLLGICRNPASPFCQSRLWSRVFTITENMDVYLEKLIALGKSAPEKIVLFPTQDDLVLLISNNRDALEPYYQFVLPEKSIVDVLLDKTTFHEWAIQNSFPVPESYIVECEHELYHVLAEIKYPVVLKPLLRTQAWRIHSPTHKIIRLDNMKEITKVGFDLFSTAPKFLIQRWIPGGDSDVHFCLTYVDRLGRELGYYTGRKLLQYPMLTGSTAIAVGTSNDEVCELTRKLFRALNFRGLGSLEVKMSAEDKRYYITEPTVGRNNLQSYIAVAGGVNLPQMAFYDAIGEGHQCVSRQRRKATWIEEYSALQAIRASVGNKDFKYTTILRELNPRVSFASANICDPMPCISLFKELLLRKLRNVDWEAMVGVHF